MARSRSIGNVYAELSVKDKMTNGIKRAQKSLAAFGSKLASIGTGMALAAPVAGFAAITASMKSAIDTGGELADMMARTGAEGEGLFVMQRAFENAGIAADKVPSVLNRMQKALATGNEGFAKLGMNIAELKQMDVTAAFRSTAEAIAKIPDPADRAAVAMEIFGKSGGELLAVMNDVAAFDIAQQQVGKLGKFLADNAEGLDKLGDTLSLFGSKAVEVGAAFAVELQPELQKFADWIGEVDLIGHTKDFIDYAKTVSSAAGSMADLVDKATLWGEVAGLISKPIEWAASMSDDMSGGTALPTPNTWIGGNPLSNYKDGIMLPGADEAKQIIPLLKEIPPLLKRPPELVAGMRLEESGIPGVASMIDAVMASLAPVENAKRETPQAGSSADFAAPAFEVNEMQRRGLGFGGETIAKEAARQVSLLTEIRDVLKRASTDGSLNWT